MSIGERTYVATAFVPFRQRRVDAVAHRLVTHLRAQGVDAERLRLPVTTPVIAAAGAALVNLDWSQNLISLEFPAFHLASESRSAYVVRGGMSGDEVGAAMLGDVARRFAPALAEPGVAANVGLATCPLPSGLVVGELRRRGVVADHGEGTLVLAGVTGVADAATTFDGSAADGEVALWNALPAEGGPFADVQVVVPAAGSNAPWAPEMAAPGEAWTLVHPDGTQAALAPADDDVDAAWDQFALGLMP